MSMTPLLADPLPFPPRRRVTLPFAVVVGGAGLTLLALVGWTVRSGDVSVQHVAHAVGAPWAHRPALVPAAVTPPAVARPAGPAHGARPAHMRLAAAPGVYHQEDWQDPAEWPDPATSRRRPVLPGWISFSVGALALALAVFVGLIASMPVVMGVSFSQVMGRRKSVEPFVVAAVAGRQSEEEQEGLQVAAVPHFCTLCAPPPRSRLNINLCPTHAHTAPQG